MSVKLPKCRTPQCCFFPHILGMLKKPSEVTKPRDHETTGPLDHWTWPTAHGPTAKNLLGYISSHPVGPCAVGYISSHLSGLIAVGPWAVGQVQWSSGPVDPWIRGSWLPRLPRLLKKTTLATGSAESIHTLRFANMETRRITLDNVSKILSIDYLFVFEAEQP